MREYLGRNYQNGETYFTVTGVVTSPALILKDPITGERKTVVIDSRQFADMPEITDGRVISILETELASTQEDTP